MTHVRLLGRTGRLTSRLLALALLGQAVVLVFFAFAARGLAIADGRGADGARLLWVGLAVAGLAVIGSGLARGPLGLPVGWLVQALTWASALLVPAMVGVAVVFTALWVLLMVQGGRADALVARREAAGAEGAEAADGSASAAD